MSTWQFINKIQSPNIIKLPIQTYVIYKIFSEYLYLDKNYIQVKFIQKFVGLW